MSRPLAVPAFVRLGVAVALATSALAACTARERAPDTARTGDTSAAPPPAPLPGQLAKPIAQYTGDEFYEFVQRLQWGGGAERDRKCKGDPGCDGTNPARHTVVRVDAVNGQDSVSATNVPANGVVTVRAINRGNFDEQRYGFRPNRRLEYYLIVLPGTGANGRWQFEELDTTAGARRHTSVGTGTFTPCNHPFRRGRVIRANFYTCADSPSSDSAQTSNLLLFDFPTDPVWTECAQGCCIAD